jgi:hypothetical protein
VVRSPGIESFRQKQNEFKNSSCRRHAPESAATVKAQVFMVLGLDPNAMDRFTLTNMRGVLQKVDFFNLIKEK